jgi:hypothetical protein
MGANLRRGVDYDGGGGNIVRRYIFTVGGRFRIAKSLGNQGRNRINLVAGCIVDRVALNG